MPTVSSLPHAVLQGLKNRRWPRWLLATLVLLYGLYVALAYLWLPGKLQDLAQTDLADLIGREVQVQAIAFNPFALSLAVEGLAVADAPQRPIVAWKRVFVDLDAWGSLFGWQLKLQAVHLDTPQIAIERRKQDFNFSDILQRLASTSEEPEPTADVTPPEEESNPLAIRIDDIRIRDGIFRFDDTSGSKPARSEVDNIDIGVQNLYLATGDDQLNPFHFKAKVAGGGKLDLSGEYRADPLQVNGTVKADGIQLVRFADFVENQVPLKVAGGALDFSLDLALEQQGKAQHITLQNGQVELKELALDDSVTEPPLLRAGSVSVKGIALDLTKQTVNVEQIRLDGIASHLWRDAQGQMRFAPLLPPPAPEEPTPPADDAKPWNVHLADIQLVGSRVSFLDQADGISAQQNLSDINLQLKDIRLPEGAALPLTLSARLNDTGSLQVNGTVTPDPLALQLQYQVQSLPLLPFNPYVEASTYLQLKSGELNVAGDLRKDAGEQAPLMLNMKLDVQTLVGNDSRTGKSVLQWQRLTVDPLALDLAAQQLTIGAVTLVKPDVQVDISADKQVNLATLAKPASPASATSSTNDDSSVNNSPANDSVSKPWQFSIASIQVQQGNTVLRDNSIQPAFSTRLAALELDVGELRSKGGQATPIELKAKLDRYAPLTVKGTLAPLDRQPGFVIHNRLQGLDMPLLSPYTGTFIGYKLRSGKLTLDSRYELKDRQLNGKSNIVARNLYLGDQVVSEQAVDAPVGLGLALLRDTKGVIDLDLAVSGNLDDPGFSVLGLVGKALLNVLMKAATSPFQLLGSIAGGREDLGQIEFVPGSAELDAAGREKLQQLAEALAQRPGIGININGNAQAAEDGNALQRQRVLQQVAEARDVAVASLDATTWLDDEDNRDELEDLADDLDLPDAGDRETALKQSQPDLQGSALQQAVFQQMWTDVSARQPQSEQDLLTLAGQRAEAIRQFLVEESGFDHERVDLPPTASNNLTARVCTLALEPE